jgi:nicotinamidase-related amidase
VGCPVGQDVRPSRGAVDHQRCERPGADRPRAEVVLADDPEIDRTSINSWEDTDFRLAVEATGRDKLIMVALWTEACLAFPALDSMRSGFEVFPVVDAVGGTSPDAHRAGLERIVQAGAQPITWVSLACELQRDWARTETVADVVDIVLSSIFILFTFVRSTKTRCQLS